MLIGVFVVTCALAPVAARAGTYAMWSCSVPGHQHAALGPWRELDVKWPNLNIVDACASGGGVSIPLGASREMEGGSEAGIQLDRPSGLRSEVRFVKLVVWYAAQLSGSGQPINFWSADWRSDGSKHWGLSNSPPGSPDAVAEHRLEPETTVVRLGIHCGPLIGMPTAEPCTAASGVPLQIRGLEVTLAEDVPPLVRPPAGSLLAAGAQQGVRTLTYTASDAQSGLSRIEALVDDEVVATHDLSDRCSHADFTVCPAADDGTLLIDTRSVGNGTHAVGVRVGDAAGNTRTVAADHAILIANPPDAGDALPYALAARFKDAKGSTIVMRYGARISIQGRLTRGSRPVPRTRVELLARPGSKDAHEATEAVATTDADGAFSIALSRTRASRTIRVAYAVAPGRRVTSRSLNLRVLAAAQMHASLHGRTVRFSGRVLSKPVPRRGKRILMEGRGPGSGWTVFKSLRTDRKGRFSGTYRLRVRRPGVRLKIRAVVPRENGYGYLTSRSRAVTLRVR